MASNVKISWDSKAIEQEVRGGIERRLERVRCPVHGTGATIDPEGELKQPCCDKLIQAVRRALR